MPSMLLKKILLNPKVLLGIGIMGAILYHFYTVNALEKNLAVTEKNYIQAKQIVSTNNDTIDEMSNDILLMKEGRKIIAGTYIKEIERLKGLIFELTKKKEYTDVIKVKEVIVPVIKEGKTVYVNKCEDIEVRKITPEDSNNSLIRIISNIGK